MSTFVKVYVATDVFTGAVNFYSHAMSDTLEMTVSLDANAEAMSLKPPRALRVAVVEDDGVVRVLLEYLLNQVESDCHLLGLWKDGESALHDLPALSPDVVVVDLELPFMSGAELISRLTAKLPKTAFVVLTVHDDPLRVFAALRAGAHGYLLKGSNRAEIVIGIRAASEGVAPPSVRQLPNC